MNVSTGDFLPKSFPPDPAEDEPTCYFVTDANRSVGFGHVSRCAVLARRLVDLGIACCFIFSDTDEKVDAWLEKKDLSILRISRDSRSDPEQLFSIIRQSKAGKRFIVFDTDQTDFYEEDFQVYLRESNVGLMMITFFNKGPFFTHFIHNQNPLSLDATYLTPLPTKKLLGLEYVILKEEYDMMYERAPIKDNRGIQKMLVTFGGADKASQTVRIVQILNNIFTKFSLAVDVVIGMLNTDKDELKELALASPHNMKIWVATERMPDLMFKANFAISSGGLTLWEFAACNTINFVIPTSEREVKSAEKLASQNLIIYEGDYQEINTEVIRARILDVLDNPTDYRTFALNFHKRVNPKGTHRVADHILSWFGEISDDVTVQTIN